MVFLDIIGDGLALNMLTLLESSSWSSVCCNSVLILNISTGGTILDCGWDICCDDCWDIDDGDGDCCGGSMVNSNRNVLAS